VARINYCPGLCPQKLMNITDNRTMAETHPHDEIWSPEFHNIKPRYRDVPWVTVICNYVLGVATIKPGTTGNRFNDRLRPISLRSVLLHPHTIQHSRISIIRGERDRHCLELPKPLENTDYDNGKNILSCVDLSSSVSYSTYWKSHNDTEHIENAKWR
jgi:hypothetical protein